MADPIRKTFDEWSALWNASPHPEYSALGALSAASYGASSTNLYTYDEWWQIARTTLEGRSLPLGPLTVGQFYPGFGVLQEDGTFRLDLPAGVPPPGPSTTVPVGQASSATAQAPANPDSGTKVSAPPLSPEKHNFDEWNWYYQQQTGRTGPDPAEVGVADRTALLTRDEWWAKVKDWYGGSTALPAGGSGSGSETKGTLVTTFSYWVNQLSVPLGLPKPAASEFGLTDDTAMDGSAWLQLVKPWYAAHGIDLDAKMDEFRKKHEASKAQAKTLGILEWLLSFLLPTGS